MEFIDELLLFVFRSVQTQFILRLFESKSIDKGGRSPMQILQNYY